MRDEHKTTLEDIKFVKIVHLGGVNPNHLLSDQELDEQQKFLNKCLNDFPKGVIIGKDTSIGRYMIGSHELTMERTSYHIGFTRKPAWLDSE